MQGSRRGVVAGVALLAVSVLVGVVLIIEPLDAPARIGSEPLGPSVVAAEGPVSLHLDPDSGTAGSSLSVSGAGFTGGEVVVLYLRAERIGSVTADDAGAFSDAAVSLPGSVAGLGRAYVVAIGGDSARTSMAVITLD